MNHTPTPWHTTGSSTNSDAPIYICGHVSTMMLPQDYRHVATVNREEELGWGEGLDNAAFILRACNAHEALVKAATDLLAYLPASHDGFQVKLEDALVEALQFAGADIKVTTGE